MNANRFMAKTSATGLLLLFSLAFHFLTAITEAEDDMTRLLPSVSCTNGWNIEGTPVFYNRETLSDRINGEAELYFPYGFDRMAAARYGSEKSPGAGIDVEIYRMGSLLDAFGMYANYRQKEGRSLKIGAESNISASQFYLYQDRFFIHIQITGIDTSYQDALAECAIAVTSMMPDNRNRPPELLVFDRPEILKGTERYLPQNLLGYDFLNRGIMADAVVNGVNLQIFRLLGLTTESASTAFNFYGSQLSERKIESGGKSKALLEGLDPLYGPVIVMRNGNCLTGALKFSDKKGIRELLDSLCR